jgi:hypothetical protein
VKQLLLILVIKHASNKFAMKKNIAVMLFLTLLSQVALASGFTDVLSRHHNFVAIQYLSGTGVIHGYEDETFKPQQAVNRVEALKIIIENKKIELTNQAEEEPAFKDTQVNVWYSPYLTVAKEMKIVSGNPDGTFAPEREVIRAEFIKMLLMANNFKKEKWEAMSLYSDVKANEWYTPYMNYAGEVGLLNKDQENRLYPEKVLTRGEVAEIMYIMEIILNSKNTQFLLDQAETQMSQIDVYIGNNDPIPAKRASELAVDITQQAYKNKPDDAVVLGVAKLARAYNFVVNAYLAAIQQKYSEAENWAKQAISKATEAWEVNNDVQQVARHIKDRANEILSQINQE